MIHNVLIIDSKDGTILVRVRFWKIDFLEQHVNEFLIGYRDLKETEGIADDTPIFVDKHKVFHSPINDDMILLFVTDGRDEDRVIRHKVREGAARVATALRGSTISYVRDNLSDILGELIFTHFKVSFVGSGGVGKSTLLRLLFGKDPAPGGYVPTINVSVDSSETIQFGTFMVTIWDFAGQAVFQDLWGFYFQGTDIIFLVTDSSFRNVMQTKTLLRSIRKEAPAVPLFIVANKQDLPESMKADKIQRLLGAPTFPMVATDRSRREEFIRFMLEVAAKTVGVQLPDLPLSEMITVHRRSEPVSAPDAEAIERMRSTPRDHGFEDVPCETEEEPCEADLPAEDLPVESTGEAVTQRVPVHESTATDSAPQPATSKILHLALLLRREGLYEPVFHLDYAEESSSTSSLAGVISALDSFSGIEAESEDGTVTDALRTIKHEGNLVLVERSNHFILVMVVTGSAEDRRQVLSSLLTEIEDMYRDVWDNWNGDKSVFETCVFAVIDRIPLKHVSLDYMLKTREAGKNLPFSNREVGREIVEVLSAIEPNMTVGGLVRALGLPREVVLGALQILVKFGWVDFRVEVLPSSMLRKIGPVDEETRKTYGDVIVKFADMCDGTSTLEEVAKRANLSLPAMRFVATKLVLNGVLEIVV